MATNKQEQARAVYEMWEVILQHRWRFVLPAFAVTALVLCASLFLPRKYEAAAQFERRNAPELIEAIRSGASESYIDPIQSVTKEVVGSHAIAQVVTDLEPRLKRAGYIDGRADTHRLRNYVKQHLLVHRESADHTGVRLRLELVMDDPHVASLIVNGLVQRYIDTTRSQLVDRAHSSIAYYDNLIEQHRAEMEENQTALGAFEQEHAMLLPDQPYSFQAQLAEAQDHLSMLTTDLEGIQIRRRSLVKAIEAEPATLPSVVHGNNPEVTRLQHKLEELEEEIREHIHTKRMTEKHPAVVALRGEQAELQARLEKTEKQIVTSTQDHPNPKRAELELALNAADAERDSLQEQIALRRNKINELSAMAGEMPPARAEHRKLLAAVSTSQKDVDYYENMRRRAENYLTPETGDRGVQLEFIQKAQPMRQPVSPDLFQVILVAGFMGAASGALSVFLAHRTDESFRNARQVAESTSIPVLGSVSELITRQHRRVRRLRYTIVYPANALVMASVLVMFAGLLYLDLERPDLMNELKDRAKSMVTHPMQQGTDPTGPVGLLLPEEPNA